MIDLYYLHATNLLSHVLKSREYSEPCQASRMELFMKVTFSWQGSEYVF